MAKKKPEAPQPAKVSQLPLPISDSPLVIDLPDGQKLVIGKMAEGSVIEVATWRGTGRPDSRTSRLMLGMSPGNISTDGAEATGYASGAKSDKKAEGVAKYLEIAKGVLITCLNLVKKLPLGKLKNIKLGKIKLPARKPKLKKPDAISAIASLSTSNPPSTSNSVITSAIPAPSSKATKSDAKSDSKSDSKGDVDDWIAQIIQKAESRSKIDSKPKNSPTSSPKTPAPKKKQATSVKKSAKGKK
ncbi:MAG: hypothetical protein ACOYK0_05315 [Candidatus Nanopelagicaceae bacterium]